MKLENLDENLELLVAAAELELEGTLCSLNHGIEQHENPKAVDYLCQQFGNRALGAVEAEVRIPICEECASALYSKNWLLFYCVKCHSSQWLYKPEAKKTYDENTHIIWLDMCPKCVTFDELQQMKDEQKS